ncbi:hypothetical protein [Thiorhodococcus minor]|uniref:Uncharacterized protein n=1 Tax=Thiorhodococcus minor TaxID=57489 RepID=A0A6M0K5B9_9GAMM|nr:hypothetical protein [Thiorhodococcus minor]NEV64123.1 hypothetical protein [Thiorhodococcus minor]
MREPKKRGRKSTGKALTGAERQRRYMERLKAGANGVTDANRVEALERELAEAKALIDRLEREKAVLLEELEARPRAPGEPVEPDPALEAEFREWLAAGCPDDLRELERRRQ